MSQQAERVVYVAGFGDLELRIKIISLLKKKGFTISKDAFIGFNELDVDACVLVRPCAVSSFEAGWLMGRGVPVIALMSQIDDWTLYAICSAVTNSAEKVPELLEEHIRLSRAIKDMMADKESSNAV